MQMFRTATKMLALGLALAAVGADPVLSRTDAKIALLEQRIDQAVKGESSSPIAKQMHNSRPPITDRTVSVRTEWDPLEEIIVARGGNIFPNKYSNWIMEASKILPGDDGKSVMSCIVNDDPRLLSNWGVNWESPDASGKDAPCKDTPDACCQYNKVKDEVGNLIEILERYNVTVHRPEYMSKAKLEQNYGTDTFARQGAMNQFARDVMQVVENVLIELTPGAANRRGEILNYKKLLEWRFEGADAAVISMPSRDFSVQNYGAGLPGGAECDAFEGVTPNGANCISPYDKNDYVVIEGGDVMLMGDTILVGHSENTAMGSSLKGIRWLQQTLDVILGKGVKTVVPIRMDAKILHLDIVMSLPREGLALVASKPFKDGSLPFPDGLPEIFSRPVAGQPKWDIIEVSGLAGMYMACNALPISPEVLVMASNSLAPREIQREFDDAVIEIKARGITVHTIDYGYHGFNGGALRCSSHPLRRRSPEGP